jgi:hypothetical protein
MAKRIFFGSSALAVKSKYVSGFNNDGTEITQDGSWVVPKGIQSVGFSTSVAFEPMFQLGQTEVYGRMETQSPQVECTISKAIDGSQMLYTTLNGGHANANNKAPAELASNQVEIALGIYAESVPYASGNTQAAVYCSGMYVSNVQIQLPLDGVATEQLTLVGDTRKWLDSSNPIAGNLGDSSRGVIGSGSAPSAYQRWTLDKEGSTLPLGVSGYPLQSVNVTMSIGREVIQELGTRGKYCRYATFPFEVTSEFEVIAGKGRTDANRVTGNDQAIVISGYDFNNYAGYACASDDVYDIDSNDGSPSPLASVDGGEIDGGYRDQEIKIKLCGKENTDHLTIDLGKKNRVTSVNYAGGDTGGGNVTLTYSFQTYNYLQLDGVGSYSTDALVLNPD